MKRPSLLIWSLLALPGFALGDVVHLKDGSRLEGEIKRVGDEYVVTGQGGKVTRVPSEKVGSIEVKPQVGDDAAMGRLQSLRRAAENLSDFKQILERYKTFIDQNSGTPAAVEAKADVEMWQDRQTRGLIKLGDKWITPEERDTLRGQSSEEAIHLHDMLKQGRLKEATPILDKALAVDPQSMSLLYLRGVLTYQQEQLPPSRKAFEAVLALAPDHAPTLNNLGVVLWRQNAIGAALGYYDRALLAAPANREILDNIAEALNALPKDQRETAVTKKLVRHFKEQDDDAQKKLAAKGMYRWGSSWVNEKELAKLQDAEKAIKDKLDVIANDFDAVTKRIAEIDRRIGADQQELALIDSQSYAQGTDGRFVRLPLPQRYYTVAREIDSLKAERADRLADQDRLKKAAKQLQQQLPVPKYTGIQKLIDADGMPLPAAAATKPAKGA
ncbi:MAG: hhoB [Phycisphaerales bacterium]|nr:hhoB [Phycisphaerales bacterium]